MLKFLRGPAAWTPLEGQHRGWTKTERLALLGTGFDQRRTGHGRYGDGVDVISAVRLSIANSHLVFICPYCNLLHKVFGEKFHRAEVNLSYCCKKWPEYTVEIIEVKTGGEDFPGLFENCTDDPEDSPPLGRY